jgi:hypothetical protein
MLFELSYPRGDSHDIYIYIYIGIHTCIPICKPRVLLLPRYSFLDSTRGRAKRVSRIS